MKDLFHLILMIINLVIGFIILILLILIFSSKSSSSLKIYVPSSTYNYSELTDDTLIDMWRHR